MQDAAHGSLLRSARQRLHAQIAEALGNLAPELREAQPELFAQHYAEAGRVEESIAFWRQAGRRSATRSAMAEAAAQFQKGLDQLGLLPDGPERQRQELELRSRLGAALMGRQGLCGAVSRRGLRACPRIMGAARFPFGISSDYFRAIELSHNPRRIGSGAAPGRRSAAAEASAQ